MLTEGSGCRDLISASSETTAMKQSSYGVEGADSKTSADIDCVARCLPAGWPARSVG